MAEQSVGERVRAFRRARGLGLRPFAEWLGCSHATVRRIEQGETLTEEQARRLSRVMRVPLGSLWTRPKVTLGTPPKPKRNRRKGAG